MTGNKSNPAETITIRPAKTGDRRIIFEWLVSSDLTHRMLGPPDFTDNPAPSWEEFCNDYHTYFFDGSQPLLGRCFVISAHGEDIGQINYNPIDLKNKCTELDIWLSDSRYTGKGYGSKAIQLLCVFLKKAFDLEKIYIAPSGRNVPAIRAYQKAGFTLTANPPENFVADYYDSVVLVYDLTKTSIIAVNG